MNDFLLLFIAGLAGGVLNSIAGGGSFITFPALIFVGVPPLIANATNTFASCAGYLSGTFAFRHQLRDYKKELVWTIVLSLIGGASGAYLLLNTSESSFQNAIPWLLLFATLLFMFGSKANTWLQGYKKSHHHTFKIESFILPLTLLGASAYGGFFNAGLGIIVLSYLTLAGHSNINVMNGMKLVVSSSVSFVAIVLFVFSDSIAWVEGGVVLVGTLIGGYYSASISMKLPQEHVRLFVVLMSCAITGYFFYITYV